MDRNNGTRVAGQAAGQAIVKTSFEMGRVHGSEAARLAYPDDRLTSQDAIANEAVRLMRKAKMALGSRQGQYGCSNPAKDHSPLS